MLISLTTHLATLSSIFRSRAALQLETWLLSPNRRMLQRSSRKRPKLTPGERLVVDLVVPPLERLALSTGHGEARNGFRLFWTGRCGAANPDDLLFPARSEI